MDGVGPMKIIFAAPKLPGRGAAAVGVMAGAKLSPSAVRLDKATGGALGRAMKGSRFTGKKGQILEVLGPSGVGVSRILLAGIGKPGEPSMFDRAPNRCVLSPMFGRSLDRSSGLSGQTSDYCNAGPTAHTGGE